MNKRGHLMNAGLLAVGLGAILTVDPRTPIPTDAATSAILQAVELLLPVLLGALFPDVDTAFGRHRKTLHNLPVLALFVAYPLYVGNLQFVWIGVATHYVLDVVGSRRGIALFYPLSETEYGFPAGVTTSSRFAGAVTVVVTGLELGVLAGIHYYLIALDAGAEQMLVVLGV